MEERQEMRHNEKLARRETAEFIAQPAKEEESKGALLDVEFALSQENLHMSFAQDLGDGRGSLPIHVLGSSL